MTPDHEAAMRCPDCDKPLAKDNGHEGGCECAECVAMCWREWNGPQEGVCRNEHIDWRARYLAQSAELSALRAHQRECVERWRKRAELARTIEGAGVGAAAADSCADELEAKP